MPDDVLDDDEMLLAVLAAVQQLAAEPGVRDRVRAARRRPSDGHGAEADAPQRSDQFGGGADQEAIARELDQVQVRDRIRAPEGGEDGGRIRRFGERDVERAGERGLADAAGPDALEDPFDAQPPAFGAHRFVEGRGRGDGARSGAPALEVGELLPRARRPPPQPVDRLVAGNGRREAARHRQPGAAIIRLHLVGGQHEAGAREDIPEAGLAIAARTRVEGKAAVQARPARFAVQVVNPARLEQPFGPLPRPRDHIPGRRRRLALPAVDLGRSPRVRDPVRTALPEAAHADRRRRQHRLGLEARKAERHAGEVALPLFPHGLRRRGLRLAAGVLDGLHAALSISRAVRCATAWSSAVSSGVAA